jgi:2-polyprenyl-3-methyl-5-hydroxy-6-metoxy-1,4-benzoquinol methylase
MLMEMMLSCSNIGGPETGGNRKSAYIFEGCMKASAKINNRFQSDAGRYAGYLDTPEGRLRLDLGFGNLQESLPAQEGSSHMCALDLGCGTGAIAVRLAQLGFHVTLLDSSQAMLDIAQSATREAGVSDQVTVQHRDVTRLSSLFNAKSFDVIVCHNLLEYVNDPGDVLRGAAALLRDSSAILSVLVRSQAGEVLKAAIQTGDLAAAEDALTCDWGQESLYGGKVRLFTLERIRSLMKAASLRVIAERGVRVVSDYLPHKVSRSEEYERIFELERKLGGRAEFVAAARYIQVLARRFEDRA